MKKELLPLLALILIAGGIWLFAEIADEVNEGETRRIEARLPGRGRFGAGGVRRWALRTGSAPRVACR